MLKSKTKLNSLFLGIINDLSFCLAPWPYPCKIRWPSITQGHYPVYMDRILPVGTHTAAITISGTSFHPRFNKPKKPTNNRERLVTVWQQPVIGLVHESWGCLLIMRTPSLLSMEVIRQARRVYSELYRSFPRHRNHPRTCSNFQCWVLHHDHTTLTLNQ